MKDLSSVFPYVDYIATPYTGILLDAYGVFRGGNNTLLPGAMDAMERLVSSGKVVGILTNTTQISHKEIHKLATLGLFEGKHFHFLITSGDVAKTLLAEEKLPFQTPNKKFWLFGQEHPKFSSHLSLFCESAYTETPNIDEADFIYISIPHINGEDQTDREIFRGDVAKVKKYGLPMVCTNPDCFAHEGVPPRAVVRQGSIAAMHEELGGNAFYVGKPSNLMFTSAMRHFADFKIDSIKDILMVGDTPETDIRGARNFGISAALLTRTGIFADRVSKEGLKKSLQDLPQQDIPDYLLESLGRI